MLEQVMAERNTRNKKSREYYKNNVVKYRKKSSDYYYKNQDKIKE